MPKNALYSKLIRKVVRADKHIGNLQVECDRFYESRPYTIDIDTDSQTRETIYHLRCVKPIPRDITLITGDALNNLRNALDHTMWHFATQCTPVPHRKSVYFPILGSAAKYETFKGSGKIGYLGQNVIDVLDTIKPYKGGNNSLWKLNELNNIDKHRLLISVAHAYKGRTETAAETNVARDRWTKEHPNETFIAADISRIVPAVSPGSLLNAGDIVLRIPPELNEQPKVVIDIALAEVGIAESESLIPTLAEISRAVGAVIYTMVYGL